MAEVTVAVLPFLITGEVWIVQAHRFVKFIRVSIICYISSVSSEIQEKV